jgi:hypothetical protein
VPDQQVGVSRGPVHVRGERVEPHDIGRERWIDWNVRAGGEFECAWKEVNPEVGAVAAHHQLLNLRIGLGSAKLEGDLREHQLRHRQTDRCCEPADDDLGDERLGSLARGPKLDDIQAVVIRLD